MSIYSPVIRVRHTRLLRQLVKKASCCLSASLIGSHSFCTGIQTMSKEKFQTASRLHGSEKNLWVEITQLTVEQKALNLGQGFPDFMAPKHVVECLKEVINSNDKAMHQYTRSFGHPRLVKAVAKLYEPLLKHEVDPMTEVLITVGAYGSLFCVIQGLVNPGDEVIIIEPFFDCYEPMVKVAKGVPIFIPLRPTKQGDVTSSKDWKLDAEELASKFTDKTKLIILNTPNNPLGKVYSKDELQMVADLCKKHDVVCIADEVYEWMTYDDNKHVKIASLPDMWERTLTIGSAGKTFSVTGWKTGWCVGPKHLVKSAQYMHQNTTYNIPTPIQEAVARGLELEMSRLNSEDCYLTSLSKELKPKRDNLVSILKEVGMKPIVPEGGYFVVADYTNTDYDISEYTDDEPRDFKFVKWLTCSKKLNCIPPTAFYCKEHKHLGENYARFCFIKEDETLEKAAEILRKWRDQK